jgi:hypothetical protein
MADSDFFFETALFSSGELRSSFGISLAMDAEEGSTDRRRDDAGADGTDGAGESTDMDDLLRLGRTA